jgi:hypothetical protein
VVLVAGFFIGRATGPSSGTASAADTTRSGAALAGPVSPGTAMAVTVTLAIPDQAAHPTTVRLTTLSSASVPDPDADDLTPSEAQELARALLEAARLAES